MCVYVCVFVCVCLCCGVLCLISHKHINSGSFYLRTYTWILWGRNGMTWQCWAEYQQLPPSDGIYSSASLASRLTCQLPLVTGFAVYFSNSKETLLSISSLSKVAQSPGWISSLLALAPSSFTSSILAQWALDLVTPELCLLVEWLSWSHQNSSHSSSGLEETLGLQSSAVQNLKYWLSEFPLWRSG